MLPVNATVLHVDDDPAITRVIAAQLSRFGIAVVSINDASSTMECVLRDQHRIVILDVDMPVIDGLELLTQIKALDDGIRVIMLTGRATTNTVIQSRQGGAEACFFKPLVNVGALAEAILAPTNSASSRVTRQIVAQK